MLNVLFLFCLWYAVIVAAKPQIRGWIASYRAWRMKWMVKKKTEYMVKAWMNISRSYDPVTESDKRALALARAMNLQHELIEMEKGE